MDQLKHTIAADRRRNRDRFIVIGAILVVLVAAAVVVTVWSGVGREPSAELGFCEPLSLRDLPGFGEVDGGEVVAAVDGDALTCTGTYRDGTVTATVTVQDFPDEAAARGAFDAVPAVGGAAPGLTDTPLGWDDVRREHGGGGAQDVLLRGTTLAVVLLDLPTEIAPGDMEAAREAVSRTSSEVLNALEP